MKAGCCLNMLSGPGDPLGIRYLPLLTKLGYDYVELPLAQMMELPDHEFDALVQFVGRSGVSCECCNNFFQPGVRLTGDAVSHEAIGEYLGRSLERAGRLGVQVIVFGSSGAKNVPEGFDARRAFEQAADTLRRAAERCAAYGITIAIEPLNRQESNLILNLTEGKQLMDAVRSPQVRLLVDYYHFAMEEESLELLRRVAGDIVHVHFAQREGRRFPQRPAEEYDDFFRVLREAGYRGRCSMEAFSSEPERDLERGRQWMKTMEN